MLTGHAGTAHKFSHAGGDVDIFAELTKMQDRLLTNTWDVFQTHYEGQCAAANPEVARQIADTELNYYNDRHYDAYCKALKKARSADALAIYFEYDIDNDWQSSFFVCKEYADLEVGDDDWACRWLAQVRGSCISKFAGVYNATDKFCRTPEATAITLFLIARTAAALKMTVARKPPGTIKICIGFHDQNPIHRL